MTQRMNIAIDGPAGSGKSTMAKELAKRLGILYLDTGAMYRACAYFALTMGLSVTADVSRIIDMMDTIVIDIRYDEDGTQRVIVNKIDVSSLIRQNHISQAASDISKIPEVRLKLVALQRRIAAENDCVLDGRDITSYVLPNAKYKFYLDADPAVRAKRRVDELATRGQIIPVETMLEEIKKRDHNDMTRDFAPLVRTADAMYIDTSLLTVDEVLNKILEVVRA